MPYVSQSYVHPVSECPKEATTAIRTYCAFYDSSANCSPTSYINHATWGLSTHRDISATFYKDIRNFLISVRQSDLENFPYTLEFLEDADVVYANNQKMPPFKIGTNSYCLCVADMGNSVSYSVPFPFVYYNITSATSSYPWLMPYSNWSTTATSPGANIGMSKYRVAYNLYDATDDAFEYTLHCFYNTDFLVLAFSTPTTTMLFSFIQQIRCWDRFGVEYYMISHMLGFDFTQNFGMGSFCILRLAEDADYYYYSNIAQSLGREAGNFKVNANSVGFWYAWDINYDSTEYPFTMSGATQPGSMFPCIINPCLNYSGGGKWPNLSILNIPLEETDPVMVSKLICFWGAIKLTDQVLCASQNIINDKEYTFNGKKYYVFGDFEVKHVLFPVLFEFDVADPEP